MSRPTTSEDRAFYYPDKRLADDDHRQAFEAESAAIERDAAAHRRRLSILAAHPEREDRGDKLLRYLERERARRKRYLSNHLTVNTITIRRAKP